MYKANRIEIYECTGNNKIIPKEYELYNHLLGCEIIEEIYGKRLRITGCLTSPEKDLSSNAFCRVVTFKDGQNSDQIIDCYLKEKFTENDKTILIFTMNEQIISDTIIYNK